jgi:hypothetical protein
MIFFENNKVLGVEPNRVLNILEGILKNKHGLKRAGVKKVSALVVHVYTLNNVQTLGLRVYKQKRINFR